jgi:hypothetical protein
LDFRFKTGEKVEMKIIKKTMSVVVIAGLVISQIGCASKMTKISAPLDQVKFEKDYRYTVKLKAGNQIDHLDGDQIQSDKDKLILKTQTTSKDVSKNEIYQIEGISKNANGTNALKGMVIGGASIGTLFFVLGMASADSYSDTVQSSNGGDGASAGEIIGVGLLAGAIGAVIGGTAGLGIGALIPKHDRVQITPIVNPTTSGLDAGVNVGVKF